MKIHLTKPVIIIAAVVALTGGGVAYAQVQDHSDTIVTPAVKQAPIDTPHLPEAPVANSTVSADEENKADSNSTQAKVSENANSDTVAPAAAASTDTSWTATPSDTTITDTNSTPPTVSDPASITATNTNSDGSSSTSNN